MVKKGNPYGNLFGSGHYDDNVKKEWESNKGYYRVAFTECYEGLTEREIELRQEYAKELVAMYIGTTKELVSFRKKDTSTTRVSLDEVFYVKVGNATVGKISVRVQRAFRSKDVYFVFQEKRIRDYQRTNRNKTRTNKKDTHANKLNRNYGNRKGKKTL